MQPLLKRIGIVALKHAVNAILTNGGLMVMLHGAFNTSTAAGWWNIGKATLSVVIAREAVVWGPIVLRWTTTDDQPPQP
jgi:hypothetical protein